MTNKFCILPFIHLNIKEGGEVTSCWRCQQSHGSLKQESVKDIWNGEKVKQFQQHFKEQDTLPELGCRTCIQTEEAGGFSTRLKANEEFGHYEINGKPKQMEVRFSNHCNSQCLHCGPHYSSKWASFLLKNKDIEDKFVTEDLGNEPYRIARDDFLRDDAVDELIELMDEVDLIMISGGEPLIQPQHYKFLAKIPKDLAKNIHLSYHSNLTTLNFERWDVIRLWKRFKKVTVFVSIDATPRIYPLVRWPSNIASVEENCARLKNVKNVELIATCTTSLLNIMEIDSIFEYFLINNLNVHTSLVQYPLHLSIQNLPLHLKEAVNDKIDGFIDSAEDYLINLGYSDIDKMQKRIERYLLEVKDFMNAKDTEYFPKFVEYMNAMEAHTNNNLLEYFPEYDYR